MACAVCLIESSPLECGLCQAKLCKGCVQSVDTNASSFMAKIPIELQHTRLCPTCYDQRVAPLLQRHEETLAKAKDVYFLTKSYPGYVRVLRKHGKRVTIRECPDRRETILRMAYLAAELGFNAIIEAEVENRKIRMGKYQSSVWSGSALPAMVDGEQLERSSLRRL